MPLEDTGNRSSYQELRRRAEEILQKTRRNEKLDPVDHDLLDILNELEVHELELDLQNEELQRTTKTLEVVRDEYFELYHSAPVGFVSTDRQGRITRVNQAAVELLQPSNRLRGRALVEFIDPLYLSDYFDLLKNKAESRTPTDDGMELCLRRPGSSDIYVRLSLNKVLDEAGSVKEWRFALTDITRAKQAEKQLRRAYDGLEKKVQERTAELKAKTQELQKANQELKEEIDRRKTYELKLNKFGEKLTKAYDQRDSLSRRLVSLLERERRELGNALHDQIGQVLTGVSAQLDGLKNEENLESAALQERIDAIQAHLRESRYQVRSISQGLRTDILEKCGLCQALQSMADSVRDQSPVQVRLTTKNVAEDFGDSGIDVALYRLVQEALTNVLKHADATVVFIHLAERNGKIFLTLEDDGKGFDPDAVLKTGKTLGLTIMKERVSLMDGDFEIDSAPGRGTVITVVIPLLSAL